MNIKTWRERHKPGIRAATDPTIAELMQAEIDELRAALKAQPVHPSDDPRTLMDVTIDDDEALKFLRDMVVQEDGDLTPVRMLLCDGPDGYGLYVASADYPEDGAVMVSAVAAPVQPVQPAEQAALQEIASYIGVGGYNGATTETLVQRIKDEFYRLTTKAQPVQEPCTWHPTEAAIAALKRFEETCADNEGYDVPKDTMNNLQAIGLVYRTHGNVYCITDYGHHILAAPIAQPAPLTDADERDAFEAWIAKDCGDLSTFGTGSNIHYKNSAVNNSWSGWKQRAITKMRTGGAG